MKGWSQIAKIQNISLAVSPSTLSGIHTYMKSLLDICIPSIDKN